MRLFFWSFARGGRPPAVVILFLLFVCLPGCHSTEHTLPVPHGITVTRQDFYAQVYDEIRKDNILESVYFPFYDEWDQGENSDFMRIYCGDLQYEGKDYAARLQHLKIDSAANMAVRTQMYRQMEPVRTQYVWRYPGASVSYWKSLISDFADISQQNIEAVVFMCENGLAAISEDFDSFELKLHPNEVVGSAEINRIYGRIRSHTRPLPLNGIHTRDVDGNPIYLCFSDTVSLLSVKKMMQYLDAQKDIDNSFLYFDASGSILSIWISTFSGGMFSIPLDIGSGGTAALQYNSDTNKSDKLKTAAALLPGDAQKHLLNTPDPYGHYEYEIGESGRRANISIANTDETSGVICIQIM